jgi:hypothetical protein
VTRREATEPVIAAVYPIVNVAAVLAVASSGVFRSQAIQGTLPPYLIIQAPRANEALPVMQSVDLPVIGQEVEFQLRGVSAAPEDSEARLIVGAAVPLVDGARLVIANFEVLRVWWKWTIAYQDPELVNGIPVWNAVAQFCALLDQVN